LASSNSFSFPSWVEIYSSRINSELTFHYASGMLLENAVKEALSSKGKRIRAILSLLWCEALSGDYSQAIPIAVAYELAHAAALVQDDIIDGSSKRRGEKSIVSKYGISNAILTANMLLFQVPKKLAEYSKTKISSSALCRLFEMLGESYGAATLGEYMDLEMAKENNLSETDYEQMIRLKTGALIGAASASGAIVGSGDSAPPSLFDDAYNFGEFLGMAYQIHDDLLDLTADESVLGKPGFTDLKNGKMNLVLIYTLRNCSPEERLFVSSLIGKVDYGENEISKARELFSKYGGVEYARKAALQYTSNAKDLLSKLKDSEPRNKILELCDYLSNRNY
jgi:geranylgeranyl pyrophosphate synthase